MPGILPVTGLETHDTGAENVNAIIVANWEKIEELVASGILSAAVDGLTTLTYGATVTLPLASSKRVAECVFTGDAAIAASEKVAGAWRILILECDGTPRTLTWPAGATWVGTALTALTAGSISVVLVIARSTTDASLVLVNLAGGGGGGGGLTFVTPPATPTDSGTQGEAAYDAATGKAYLCVDTNEWIRWDIENAW